MAKLTRLGDLERAVMDHLWASREPQTVRQVHEALAAQRDLAYTTIMTVLQRLAKKNLVVQHRDDRAHRYAPTHGRDELVAGLMVDALHQAADSGGREAALVHFVERVGADEAAALRRALAELETKDDNAPIQWRSGLSLGETDRVSALAFTLVALLLVGPVPAVLARATWPMRAPRASIVLWQSIALAAVLSAFSAGIAIASRLFVPGPDGRPTATITSEIEVLGWPLWIAYVLVFALTLLIGARLVVAVVQVAIATRRRRAHHRMVVDLVGKSQKWAHARAGTGCASSMWPSHWRTAYPACVVASSSARAR